MPSVNRFNYLGSELQGSGGCGNDVDVRIIVAWPRCRDLSGVICDKKVPVKLKSKPYRRVVRPAMAYGSVCVGHCANKKNRNENTKTESRKDHESQN